MIIQTYMTKTRVKHEMVGRSPQPDSRPTETFTNSYTEYERGGLQGTDMAVTTCRLPPQPGHTVISEGSLAPGHHTRVLRNNPYPPRTPTLRMDELEHGLTRRLQRTATSNLSYRYCMNRLSIKFYVMKSKHKNYTLTMQFG
jgi:hypothetical protein